MTRDDFYHMALEKASLSFQNAPDVTDGLTSTDPIMRMIEVSTKTSIYAMQASIAGLIVTMEEAGFITFED